MIISSIYQGLLYGNPRSWDLQTFSYLGFS